MLVWTEMFDVRAQQVNRARVTVTLAGLLTGHCCEKLLDLFNEP